jgi:bifunctional non-homologous end joining protein LigD
VPASPPAQSSWSERHRSAVCPQGSVEAKPQPLVIFPSPSRSRKGLDYTHVFPELAKTARGFDNCIIDGEICFVRKDGITNFSGLQAAMKAGKTDRLVFFAFDLLFLADQDLRSKPRLSFARKTAGPLAENKDQKIVQLAEHLDAIGGDVLRLACNLKLEVSSRSA